MSYEKKNLTEALSTIGLTTGDVVYVSGSLFELGALKGAINSMQLCEAILNSFFDVIGPDGTLVVPTFTPQVARLGEAFICEQTPTNTGIFSEFVRNHPDVMRSIHPISSVAALGKHASSICGDISPCDYSMGSPSYRLYDMGAKAITLGAQRPLSGWIHLLEAMVGVPYKYNKLLSSDVYAGGVKIEQDFFANVYYMDFDISYDMANFEKMLIDAGAYQFCQLGRGSISCTEAKEFFDIALPIIKNNPYILLKKKPNFRMGEVPFDGATLSRDKYLAERNSYFKEIVKLYEK